MIQKLKGNNKLKKIYLIIVTIFLLAATLFFFQQNQMDRENNENQSDGSGELIIKDEIKQNTEEQEGEVVSKVTENDIEKMKSTMTDFIKNYYTYDQSDNEKHIQAAEPYLTPDFYKELVSTNEMNTKVPIFATRKVTNISFQNYETINETPTFVVETTAELFDESNEKLSTVDVEFHINLTQDKNLWKISYFTLVGKSIE